MKVILDNYYLLYSIIFKSQRGELNEMMGNIIPEFNKGFIAALMSASLTLLICFIFSNSLC